MTVSDTVMSQTEIAGKRRRARICRGSLFLAMSLTAWFAVACHSHSPQSGAGDSEDHALQGRIAALNRQEQALAAEISLARSPAPYLLLDLASRRIEFKVQGHSLRGYTITRIQRTDVAPSVAQAWTVTEAKPLQAPVRAKMIPGSGESTTSSNATKEPWGPKRMPSDYDLICKGDQALEIRSLLSDQSRLAITRWVVSNYRLLREWARTTLGRKQPAYRESIEIWLGEDDARLLFWSLPKQFSILLLNAS